MPKFFQYSPVRYFIGAQHVRKSRALASSIWNIPIPTNVYAKPPYDAIEHFKDWVKLPKAPISCRMFINGIEWFPKKGGKQ